MSRNIIKIDEELCNGCGLCIIGCHEGALQIVDGKVKLVSEIMCDGLGACLGECPLGAIKIENREADFYDEIIVIKELINKGFKTVVEHLSHLFSNNELAYYQEAIDFLKQNSEKINFSVEEVIAAVAKSDNKDEKLESVKVANKPTFTYVKNTELLQWPIQMHLINTNADIFKNSNLLIAADCVAFSISNFHNNFLKGKSLAIACPKLDSNKEIYENKLVKLIDIANVDTITVAIMSVPCCGGLFGIVKSAAERASRKVPIKKIIVSTNGEIVSEEWI